MTTLATPERRVAGSDDRAAGPLLSSSRSSQNPSSPSSTRQQSVSQLTVEAALGNANGDVAAALEAVLSERNMLSSQNAQLWKLIEKQRAVHGNAIKELERVRAERDRALARIDPERTQKKVPAHRSSSSSTAGLSAGVRLTDTPSPASERQNGHRYPMIRHQSDDGTQGQLGLRTDMFLLTSPVSLSSPRSSTTATPVLSASRSHEPLRPSEQQQQPLSTSPPAHTSTTPLTNGTPSPSDLVEPAQSPTLSPSDSSPPPSTSASTQLLQSKNLHEQSAPAAPKVSTVVDLSPNIPVVSSAIAATPSVGSPPAKQSSLPSSSSQVIISPPTPGLSVPPIPNRSLARESRISLPDEARRYITSMQESPMPSPSPRQASFTTNTLNGRIVEEPDSFETDDDKTQGPSAFHATDVSIAPGRSSQESNNEVLTNAFSGPLSDHTDGPSAFLDLDDDDDGSDTAETPLTEQNTQAPPFSPFATTFGSSVSGPYRQPPPSSVDTSIAPQTAYLANASSRHQPSMVSNPSTARDPLLSGPDMETRSINASPSQVAHGPSYSTTLSPGMKRIPPSSTTQAQVQAQRMAYAQAHNQDYNQTPQIHAASQPHNAGSVYGASGRARLMAPDLPRCKVSVVGSNIRANERGKEVLSFVVQVSPTGSADAADSWKVEKLYSEVLSLDARIRSRLNRSDFKRLGSLPDNKLFKDHAPAKVDQRKVSYTKWHV